MGKKNISHLIKKVILGTSTPKDEADVDMHFHDAYYSEEWDERKLGNKKDVEQNIISSVNAHINSKQKKATKIKEFIRYAAVIAFFIVVASLIYRTSKIQNTEKDYLNAQKYLQPGSDVAFLELSDGTSFDLTSLTSGHNIEKSGFVITKSDAGYLEYKLDEKNNPLGQIEWNTLRTPLGGHYQIMLDDSTKVWLNAGSTLSFPSRFEVHERMVKASGEVYFEVARNESKPFVVQTEGVAIEVLGTSFNLSSYAGRLGDKSSTVALLEGKVRLKSGAGESVSLKPGQKAFVKDKGIGIEKFDPESELAWKSNYFIFKDENIKDIMSSLARWYDAEVVYNGKGWEDKNYTVRMSRRESIEEVLSILELTKTIEFKIEERRITVYNK